MLVHPAIAFSLYLSVKPDQPQTAVVVIGKRRKNPAFVVFVKIQKNVFFTDFYFLTELPAKLVSEDFLKFLKLAADNTEKASFASDF